MRHCFHTASDRRAGCCNSAQLDVRRPDAVLNQQGGCQATCRDTAVPGVPRQVYAPGLAGRRQAGTPASHQTNLPVRPLRLGAYRRLAHATPRRATSRRALSPLPPSPASRFGRLVVGLLPAERDRSGRSRRGRWSAIPRASMCCECMKDLSSWICLCGFTHLQSFLAYN